MGLRGAEKFLDMSVGNMLSETENTCSSINDTFKLVQSQQLRLVSKQIGDFQLGPPVTFINEKQYENNSKVIAFTVIETNRLLPSDPNSSEEETTYSLPTNLLGWAAKVDLSVWLGIFIVIIIIGSYFYLSIFEVFEDHRLRKEKAQITKEKLSTPYLSNTEDLFETHVLELLRTHLGREYRVDTQKFTLSELLTLETDPLRKAKLRDLVALLNPALYDKNTDIDKKEILRVYEEFIALF